MNDLTKFLRHTAEEHPLVRIIGVCFGHQIIARAFGGEVAKNPAGWEVRLCSPGRHCVEQAHRHGPGHAQLSQRCDRVGELLLTAPY